MEEHHREELAGFREDEGYVVNMVEGGIAEGGGERGGYGYEEEWNEYAAIGEDWGGGGAGFRVEAEVHVPSEGREEGLDGIEEDGEFEFFGIRCIAVGCGG